MLRLWHFSYSVRTQKVSSLHLYFFVVSWAFMTGAASQTGDTDSSRAPVLTSGLQGSINVHRGVLLLLPQWQLFFFCISYLLRICISIALFYFCSDFKNIKTYSFWLVNYIHVHIRVFAAPAGKMLTPSHACIVHFTFNVVVSLLSI